MRVLRFDALDSTNELAKRLWREGWTTEPVCIVAREQSAGRGSRGRVWLSPRDAGVYASLLQPVPCDADPRVVTPPISTDFTLAAGVACAAALSEGFGLAVTVKPVNDLILGGRKLGGILVEGLVEAGRLVAVITGVGVNVRDVPLELPPGSAPSTSLEQHLPRACMAAIEPAQLAERLMSRALELQAEIFRGRAAPNWP